MRRRKRLVAIGLVLALLIVPGAVAAQQDIDFKQGGFLFRADGDVTLSAGDSAETLLVIDGDALVEGQAETVIVIDGTATLAGATVKDLIVISGAADLQAGTLVTNDVNLIDSDLTQDAGATVRGDIDENAGVEFWIGVWIAWFIFFVGVTIALLVAGVIAAGIAGRQLREAGALITDDTGKVALGALIVAVGAPIVAVLALVTVIGIPLGIAIFMSLGALAATGYLISAVRVGEAILRSLRGHVETGHPYGAALIGVFVLQLVSLIPLFGTLIWLIAQLAGVGAIAVLAWRAIRSPVPQAAAEPASTA